MNAKALLVTFALGLLGHPARADFISLNFAAVPGSALSFDGTSRSFRFTEATSGAFAGSGFAITSTTGGTGSSNTNSPAVGLLGSISGLFHIDADSIKDVGPSKQTAHVTTTDGKFVIRDGTKTFTADLAFTSITAQANDGKLDSQGTVNLTHFVYDGNNPDLKKLAGFGGGFIRASFQFEIANVPNVNLNYLTTPGTHIGTSFAGSLTAPAPEPATLGLLLTGVLMGGTGLALRRRSPVP